MVPAMRGQRLGVGAAGGALIATHVGRPDPKLFRAEHFEESRAPRGRFTRPGFGLGSHLFPTAARGSKKRMPLCLS